MGHRFSFSLKNVRKEEKDKAKKFGRHKSARSNLDAHKHDGKEKKLKEISGIKKSLTDRPLHMFSHTGLVHKSHILNNIDSYLKKKVNRLFELLNDNNNEVKKEAYNAIRAFIEHQPSRKDSSFAMYSIPKFQQDAVVNLIEIVLSTHKKSLLSREERKEFFKWLIEVGDENAFVSMVVYQELYDIYKGEGRWKDKDVISISERNLIRNHLKKLDPFLDKSPPQFLSEDTIEKAPSVHK